jgi:HTH-type transcriptional regulator/antitoxin HigA
VSSSLGDPIGWCAYRQEGLSFAGNVLIPAGYEGELRRLTQYRLIEAFAARLGIAPGIVVGRLQREGVVKYNQFNGLKQKLEWVEED